MNDEEVFKKVLDCCFRVHSQLGPGLLESAYEQFLSFELTKSGLKFERQKPMPVTYKDMKFEIGYRLDLIVEDKVIIEINSVETLIDVHLAQILTYLRLSGVHLGLLINFNVSSLKNGIRRVIN
jgi:GxxExxY protein